MIQNGQAPQIQSLLLIGSGRLAHHLAFYLEISKTPFLRWSRKSQSTNELLALLGQTSRVALAISDDALGPFIDQYLASFKKPILHFSGSWHRDGIQCAHPLMSFGTDLYSAEFYSQIHFALTGLAELSNFFPLWKNTSTEISTTEKPLYHALCVLGGNFPVLLWNKMETELKSMGLPETAIRLYIDRVSSNYLQQGAQALTGPLVRGDKLTIERNLTALSKDPWQKVYQAFKEVHHEHS